MMLALPSQEALLQQFDYDPETGLLHWVGRFRGRRAFGSVDAGGYHIGWVGGVCYKAHRIAWKMMTGEDPVEIDHVNGVKCDNRWENLRSVKRAVNMKNQAKSKVNSSGHTGVNWHRETGKWRAEICVLYQRKHLGLFEDIDTAIAARKAAEREYGYHSNHGRAA